MTLKTKSSQRLLVFHAAKTAEGEVVTNNQRSAVKALDSSNAKSKCTSLLLLMQAKL